MKNLLNRTSSLLMLLVLSGLIALFAFSLKQGPFLQSIAGQTQPSGYPGPKSISDSSVQDPYPSPSTVKNGTTVVEMPFNQSPEILPTQIPIVDGAFRASETRRLSIDNDLNIEQIFDDYVVQGDILIARVRLKNQTIALVEINLNDGSIQKLEEPQDFTEWRASERYVIWLNPVQEPRIYEQILQVLDREKGTTSALYKGRIEQIDLRGSLIAWFDSKNKDIVIYDFATQQMQSIAPGSEIARFPRICSEEWVAFLHNFPKHETFVSTTSADISLYHLPSGQRILVGNVSGVPNIPGVRNTSFDCDEQRLVWVSTYSNSQSNNDTELHVYDFASASKTVIEKLTGDLEPYDNFVLLDGDIIISRVGYDLAQGIPFTSILDRSRNRVFGPLHVSNNRLVWIENHENQAGNIYSVTISRGEQ